MGVPAEPRETTGAPENAKATEEDGSAPPRDETGTSQAEDGVVRNDAAVKSGVLDENANVDFKVERLQLKEITEEDDETQEDDPKSKEDKRKAAVARKRDNMADGGETSEHRDVIDDDDVFSPRGSDDLERGEDGEQEEEEEEDPPEMTLEERKAMQEAVKAGDIDLLEDLLEKPNADIKMVYFNENLLIMALRAEQLQMAEFLLDNGVDHSFTTTWVNVGQHHSSGKHNHKKAIEFYEYSCRQMAYDRGFLDIVEMIDILDGRLFPGIKPRERIPRYRRPPPTPSSITSTTDTSSSSGDESDISGDSRSLLETGENAQQEANSASPTVDIIDGHLSVPKRKKKTKTKKKAENNIEADEGSQCEGQNEKKEDVDASKERRTSRRKKQVDGEKNEVGSALGAEEEESTAGRSRSSQGDLTDRSRGTTKSSEQSGSGDRDGDLGIQDEGYETMSPSPCHLPQGRIQQQQLVPRFQAPTFPVKPTKAYLALRRTNETHKQHCIPAKYNEARPLSWKKVKSTGSYRMESPFWHQPTLLAPKLPPPTPAGTATTVSMLSPRTGVQTRSEVPSSMVSTIEINSGNITKPKILHPSQRVSSSKSSVTAVSSTTSGVGGSSSILSTYTPTNDRLYPLKLKVPGYMRMTTSCFVKRRLEPNFTNSYGSLDFVEPCPSRVSDMRSTGDTSGSSRASSEGSGSVVRKPFNSSLSSRTAAFPSVLDVSSSPSPTLQRKKTFVTSNADTINRRNETVPNIRNSSSVIQTPKLATVSAKVR